MKLFAIFALAITGGAFVEGKGCLDLKGCGRCLKNSCGWFASETEAGCFPLNSDGECVLGDNASGTEGKCYSLSDGQKENNKKAFRMACGQTCESQSTCGSCLGYEVSAGKKKPGRRKRRKSDCAWFVEGTEARCVSRSRCRKDKGFEAGSCVKGRRNKNNEKRCAKGPVDKERGCGGKKKCARCLGFSKNGATCSWRTGEDVCVETDSCTEEDLETGTCTGSTGSHSENKSTCRALNQPNGGGDKLTPEEPEEEDDEEDGFEPVPGVGHRFGELKGQDRKVATQWLEDTYGKDALSIVWHPAGSIVTEDVVYNRVRLFVDTETERIVVEVPRIG